jgi:hypothetical protein
VLDSGNPQPHPEGVSLPPEQLDKVMAELLAVSRSATSKREEAANLARIWNKTGTSYKAKHRSATTGAA